MLFNSKIFILLFLPISLLVYFSFNKGEKERGRMIWLIVISLVFYGCYKPIYLLLIIGSIMVNYVVSLALYKELSRNKKSVLLIVGLCFNIGLLFIFKYYDFVVKNVNLLFHSEFHMLQLVMPLGISFFTFQQISFLVDSYRGEMKKYSFLHYAGYVLFFPQLVAGPIVLHTELIPQFQNPERKRFSQEWFAKGLYTFAMGLAKKVLLADVLGLIVNSGFADVATLDSTNALIVMFAYTLQIYFDFSGYCDMACGIAYMFHLELPVNFNSPYKAVSVRDFWNRWHMTLTRFLTKYCYIPLGGNRKGKLREYVNILIVFAISGLWHGANWTFIIWGLMHGCAMVVERVCEKYLCKIPYVIRRILTFCFISVSWMYFRADNLYQANTIVGRIFSFDFGTVSEEIRGVILNMEEVIPLQFISGINLQQWAVVILILFIGSLMLACFFMKNTQEKILEFRPTVYKSVLTIALLWYGVISLTGASVFLYFNF